MVLKSEKGLFGKRAMGTDIGCLIRCGLTHFPVGTVRYVAAQTGATRIQGFYRNSADRNTLYAFRFEYEGIRYEAVANPKKKETKIRKYDPALYGRDS